MDRETIHALARLYGSPYKDSPENVSIRCPLASRTHAKGRDEHPSFSVRVSSDEPSVARCFSCDFAGSLARAFEEAHALTGEFGEAVAHIAVTDGGGLDAALEGLRARRMGGRPSTGESPRRRTDQTDIERYIAACSRLVPQYLINRGIVRSDVTRWRIGFDPDTMRAVFPVLDEGGRVVGCDRRSVLDPLPPGVPKYHAWPPGFKKGHYFFGEHLIDTTRETVHLVEGPMDAVMASRVLPNVLALLGAHTGIGPERLAKLRRWARKVVVIFDGDDAGRDAVLGRIDENGIQHPGLRDVLRLDFVVEVAALPSGTDPGSLPPADLLRAVGGASYVVERPRIPLDGTSGPAYSLSAPGAESPGEMRVLDSPERLQEP